jgi:hypothetical protein
MPPETAAGHATADFWWERLVEFGCGPRADRNDLMMYKPPVGEERIYDVRERQCSFDRLDRWSWKVIGKDSESRTTRSASSGARSECSLKLSRSKRKWLHPHLSHRRRSL